MTTLTYTLPDPSPQSAEELLAWVDSVAPLPDKEPASPDEWLAWLDASLARGLAFSRLAWRDIMRDVMTLAPAERLRFFRTLKPADWVSMYRALVIGTQAGVVR